jgi:hypothetical protein
MACNMTAPRDMGANGSTTRLLTWPFALALGSLLAAATAATELPGFHASYQVRNGAMTLGTIERTLRRDGEHYVYQSVTESAGLAALLKKQRTTERSMFNINDGVPRPDHYHFHRLSGSKDRTRETHFDWDSGQAQSTADGKSFATTLTEHSSDPLLYQIALMVDLSNARLELRYDVADRGRLKTYRFDDLGEQNVVTPAGDFVARLIRREKGDRGSTTFWCAAQLNFLPVRVDLVDDDGETTIAELTDYRDCAADDESC